jgi:hypothetical protein
VSSERAAPVVIAGHEARFDREGRLAPWISWREALAREMAFYQSCPSDRGYPRFAYVTFLDAEWQPHADRTDTIPATQSGMGIISYLKYAAWQPDSTGSCLNVARGLGSYLVREANTPDAGRYPSFTRSTGKRDRFPLPPDCGSQADGPFEVEPDKGGIAGYALSLLFDVTGERMYLDQALQNARVLKANQVEGNAEHSPWPFRADYRTGEGRGAVSGNMTYILRLYDAMLEKGHDEFAAARASLWDWIMRYQIPSADVDGALFAQFFEDHDTPTNRTAWAPLNLARYLLETREPGDPDWRNHCEVLVDFVRRTFTHREFGIVVCHEQDEDKQAWGGVVSTYGAVLASYAKAVGAADLASEARQALNFALYCVDDRGRPRDLFLNPAPGGWQEDAHTDVIHNIVDAIEAYPQWAENATL